MSVLYEGEAVTYIGTSMPPAHGKILHFGSETSAHVKWVTGARIGQLDLVNVYDLLPVTSATALGEIDPFSHTAVKRAYAIDGEAGVLNFLAASKQLDGWERIAKQTLSYVNDQIRRDASLEMVYEQLPEQDREKVVAYACLTLLRDAFGETAEVG